MSKKGIVLFAFGKKGYVFMANNIALSIKHFNKDLPITLFVEENLQNYIYDASIYDNISVIDNSDIYTSGVGLNPANLKVNIYKYLPYKDNLYLDVDGCALKDLEPLLDACIESEYYYLTDVIDKGGYNDTINYNIWADNSDIYPFFDLKKNDVLPALQTSWAYIKKCKDSEVLFKTAKKYYDKGFDTNKLKRKWGGKLPDELIMSGTLANLQYIPELDLYPVFYGNKIVNESFSEIISKHYILSIYGNGNGRTLTLTKYFAWYDSLVKNYGYNENKQVYESRKFLHEKFANGK